VAVHRRPARHAPSRWPRVLLRACLLPSRAPPPLLALHSLPLLLPGRRESSTAVRHRPPQLAGIPSRRWVALACASRLLNLAQPIAAPSVPRGDRIPPTAVRHPPKLAGDHRCLCQGAFPASILPPSPSPCHRESPRAARLTGNLATGENAGGGAPPLLSGR
jgi:hypothetical protein